MSSFRSTGVAGVGLLGAVLMLTGCEGDGQQGIPTETESAPTTTTEVTTTAAPTTTTAPPAGPPVGAVPGNPDAAAALGAFLTDLAEGGVPAVTPNCWTVPPSQIPARYGDVEAVLATAAQPGVDGPDTVTWSSPELVLSVTRSSIASGYACPSVFPPGSAGTFSDTEADNTEAQYIVERYLGRFVGTPVDPADLEGDYPIVCDRSVPWDPQGIGVPTPPPLADNPGRLTGTASYDPDSVYVAYGNAEYKIVYAVVTNVSGYALNQVFTLAAGGDGYCIGDIT